MNAELAPLTPSFCPAARRPRAHLHLARTVVAARRAAGHASWPSTSRSTRRRCSYLNRLSDHLFVLAAGVNDKGASDVLWVPGANR